MHFQRITHWASVSLLAAVFAFAGIDKFLHYEGFINAIDTYRFLPIPLGHVLAPLLIAAEVAIAVGLLFPASRRTAALQGAFLVLLFSVALVSNKLLGARELCGCWFSVNLAPGNLHLALNLILFVLFLVVWKESESRSRERFDSRGLAESESLVRESNLP